MYAWSSDWFWFDYYLSDRLCLYICSYKTANQIAIVSICSATVQNQNINVYLMFFNFSISRLITLCSPLSKHLLYFLMFFIFSKLIALSRTLSKCWKVMCFIAVYCLLIIMFGLCFTWDFIIVCSRSHLCALK